MKLQTPKLKHTVLAALLGVLLSLVTGFIENRPEFSIVEARYYGYPVVWRVTKTFQPSEYRLPELTVDTVFWIIVSLIALTVLQILKPKLDLEYRPLLLPAILLVPLGFIMDLAHEFGHAVWGVVLGGRLTYMKVMFFEVYPRFTVTSQFVLGYVNVDGLTGFNHGLFLLGGSMSTSIVAWLLGMMHLRIRFGKRMQVSLKLLGLFGLLDLPLYVVLPQIGLQHWVFLGGDSPEPLIGARQMGVPDSLFYAAVALSTFGLIFVFFKPLREKILNRVKASCQGGTGLKANES